MDSITLDRVHAPLSDGLGQRGSVLWPPYKFPELYHIIGQWKPPPDITPP